MKTTFAPKFAVLFLVAANAHAVVYDFTGELTSYYGTSGYTLGAPVSGTFTFNYNSADTFTGSPSSSAPWSISSAGIPYNPVFAFSVNIGAGTFKSSATAPNADPDDTSSVQGSPFTFTATESTPAFDTNSFLSIAKPYKPYNSSGDPLGFSLNTPGVTANAGLNIGGVGFDYKVDSLTAVSPVPEPPTVWLAGLGLLVLGARSKLKGRRTA